MKLLVVAPYFYPKIGGMENYAYNISKGLKKDHGWDVVVVTSNHTDNKTIIENIDGMKVYRLPILFKISNTPINPLWYFQIKKIIQLEKPDIINGHSPVPFIADLACLNSKKTPFVLTYHSGNMIKEAGFINILINLYQKKILNLIFSKSSAIVSYYPDFIKKQLLSYKKKVRYISPGVDLNIFNVNKKIKKSNDLIYVGRIEKNSDWKGINYLIDAVKLVSDEIPDIKLSLVGDGDRVTYYKKYVNILGIEKNVKFIGAKTGINLAHQYQKSKILVLPSITESESFGIVIIEGMACGIPAIGSDIGGIKYVIKNNMNGLLFKPANSSDLSKKIIHLLKNKRRYSKLSKSSEEYVKINFSWKQKIIETDTLLNEL